MNPPQDHPVSPWLLAAVAALMVAVTFGSRSALGLFVSPLNTATGIGVAGIGLAMAIGQLAWGASQPGIGLLAERYGVRPVVLFGGLLLGCGMAAIPWAHGAGALAIALALGAIGAAAAGSQSLLLATVNCRMPAQHRSLAIGIVGAGGSAGQLLLAPLSQALMSTFGWIVAINALAALALLAVPASRLFPGRASVAAADLRTPARAAVQAAGADAGDATSLGAALRKPRYWSVTAAFFVCGFHVTLLLSHMPGVIESCGLPLSLAGTWLAIVGACNIASSVLAGMLIRRFSSRNLLAGLYAARAIGVAAFLLAPKTEAVMIAFALAMGLTYMATLAPTVATISALVAPARLATLLGVTMLIHQIGAFFGAWLGGLLFDLTGDFSAVWLVNIGLTLVAVAASVAPHSDRLLVDSGQRKPQALILRS
ncbi:MAG TPA: MFS transporter [Burkholderiaceae bacterium]|nr:MFS transporter [Burkholderiaceae bacterium]